MIIDDPLVCLSMADFDDDPEPDDESEPELDWYDHPSFTASERNPNLK